MKSNRNPMNGGVRTMIVAAAICGFAGTVFSGEYHILHGASDWCVAASYAENAVPDSSDDVIFIGDGTNVTLKASDTASWAKFNEVARVVPLGPDSKLTVNVDSGTSELTKSFVAWGYVKYNENVQKYGRLVKTGAGELKLSGWRTTEQEGRVLDYMTGISVEGGALTFTPKADFGGYVYVGRVDVAAGATLNVPYDTADYAVFIAYGFNGAGTIVNPDSSRTVYLRTQGNGYDPGSFGGKLTGKFFTGVFENGYQSFTGEASDATGNFELVTSYLGIGTFGASGAESSLGKVATMDISGAGVLEYVGSGTAENPHEAGKGINFNLAAGVSATVSAGAGGVRFAGDWRNKNVNVPHQNVILSGANTVIPAFLSGPIAKSWSGTAGAARNLTLEKKGSGIWRLQPHKNRLNAGVTAVREGTLQFEGAEEAGRMSAMGLATNLCDLTTGEKVSHAIELGTTDAAPVAEAVLEYVGTTGAAVSTRPIGLVGAGGHFRNNSDSAVIRWAGALAVAAGSTPVLTLDGSSVKTNEMADITDGAGTVSVRKAGSGTWRLSGDLTFSGRLDVKQGTLLVREVEPADYGWYRWTIRGMKGGNDYAINVYIEEWGLFDADGYRLNLTSDVLSSSYAELEPGQAAFGTSSRIIYMRNGSDSLKRVFDAHPGATGRFEPLAPGYSESSAGITSWMAPWADCPETEFSIVQRLATGKSAASSWDYMPVWGGSSAPDRTTLEASVDGLHWETLDTVDPETVTLYITDSGNSQNWAFSGVPSSENKGTDTKAYTSGRRISSQASSKTYSVFPADASPTVSVAPGAELVAETSGIVLRKLAVSPAGSGSVKGFELAAAGTIDVVSDEELEPCWIPFDFSDTETAGNLSGWTVTLNGAVPAKYVMKPSAEGIAVAKRGFLFLVR